MYLEQNTQRRINFIEILIICYLVVGGIESQEISIISNLEHIFSLIIQVTVLIKILSGEKINFKYGVIVLYIFNMFSLLFIFLYFYFTGTDFTLIFNRILTLVSVLGILLVLAVKDSSFYDLNKILKVTLYIYGILGMLIIFDAISYILLGIAVWPPISYLGSRFSGPFFDPNFYGVYFGVLLIIVVYKKVLPMFFKKTLTIIFLLNVILSFSWSVIGVLTFSVAISYFIKYKNLFLKQTFILAMYAMILLIYLKYQNELRDSFIDMVSLFMDFGIEEINAKFNSLVYRFETQIDALKFFIENPLGMGPRTIVEALGRDTHNSYVGIIFELGIIGFILIYINFSFSVHKYNKTVDILSTFLFFMALTLNVHYLNLLPLMLLLLNDKRL